MTVKSEQTSAPGGTFDVVNPATRESVGTFPIHDADEVARRVAAARAAQAWWEGLGFDGRKTYLRRWLRWLALHCDEIYEIGHGETARPKADVQFELFAGLEDIRWAAANARRVLRAAAGGARPRDVQHGRRRSPTSRSASSASSRRGTSPSTRPCPAMAYALAAGNAVVVKPSELSPASAVYAVESFHQANPDAPEALSAG